MKTDMTNAAPVADVAPPLSILRPIGDWKKNWLEVTGASLEARVWTLKLMRECKSRNPAYCPDSFESICDRLHSLTNGIHEGGRCESQRGTCQRHPEFTWVDVAMKVEHDCQEFWWDPTDRDERLMAWAEKVNPHCTMFRPGRRCDEDTMCPF